MIDTYSNKIQLRNKTHTTIWLGNEKMCIFLSPFLVLIHRIFSHLFFFLQKYTRWKSSDKLLCTTMSLVGYLPSCLEIELVSSCVFLCRAQLIEKLLSASATFIFIFTQLMRMKRKKDFSFIRTQKSDIASVSSRKPIVNFLYNSICLGSIVLNGAIHAMAFVNRLCLLNVIFSTFNKDVIRILMEIVSKLGY